MSNLSTCHRCLRAHNASCSGPCLCPPEVEAAKSDPTVIPVDIMVHAREGKCPMNYFDHPEDIPAAPSSQPTKPLPFSVWPSWTIKYVKRRNAADKGVGDTRRRLYAKIGGERWKKFRKKIGWPCSCGSKQTRNNQEFPYDGIDGRPSRKIAMGEK